MRETLANNGINWIWYLVVDLNEADKTASIVFYGRYHKYDQPKHPKVTDRRQHGFVEDMKRVVTAVVIDLVVYTVTNPQYIFNYTDASQVVLE